MVSQRKVWEKKMGCIAYICPVCKRGKGMLYLFPDKSMRYVCFCGANVSVGWINASYDFKEKKYIRNIDEVKEKGNVNESLSAEYS